MAKEKTWSFQTADGTPVQVTLRKNRWISVNGDAEMNIKTLKDSVDSNIFENAFNIPLPNGETAKFFAGMGQKVVYQGKDVETGLDYEAASIPKWTYVFFVLFVVNWFFIMGGALGALASLFGAYGVYYVAARTDKGTGVKVGLSALVYVGVTILSLVIVSALR